MATMKKLKAKGAGMKQLPRIGCSYVPANPSKKLKRQSEGRDCHENDILAILNGVILVNYQSFNLSTAISLTSHLQGVGTSEVIEVYETWANELERAGKIRKSPLFDNLFINPLV